MHFLKSVPRYLAVNNEMSYTEVLFEEMKGQGSNLGIITLNRPAALNSLNQAMVLAMHEKLLEWESAKHIKAVIIKAAEGSRAFCAGGDLRSAYEQMKAHAPVTDFFRDEYQLNRKIFHYTKPYIALLDGITMGGGVGISIHGSHRVATEKLLFAMPETGIGFFPDVGGSYFLPRLPNKTGIYLGLTGARIKTDACMETGIATHKISHEVIPDLIQELAKQVYANNPREDVSNIIQSFSTPVTQTEFEQHEETINQCFAYNKMEEILQALKKDGTAFSQQAEEMIAKKSPTSLKVSLQAMLEGSQKTFDECMRLEYRLVSRFLRCHDFQEGIRAVIIDKDQKPVWDPSSIQAVTDQDVLSYFAPLQQELA